MPSAKSKKSDLVPSVGEPWSRSGGSGQVEMLSGTIQLPCSSFEIPGQGAFLIPDDMRLVCHLATNGYIFVPSERWNALRESME